MDGESNRSPFQGANRVSAILVTLFLCSFAVALFYVFYRQYKGGWERPGVINPWRNTFAGALDQNEKPILWDVYIETEEKAEWEWGGFRPLSIAVLDTLPTLPWTPQGPQKFSKEEEETVHVSAIIVFPSQRKRKPGYVRGAEVEDYAIGITGVRCRGLTPDQ